MAVALAGMSIVCKFGGTSLSSPDRIRMVERILHDGRRFVVVSAPGSRVPGEKKVTALLKDLYTATLRQEGAGEVVDEIARRYRGIYGSPASSIACDLHERIASSQGQDELYASLLSAGEFWQAKLFAGLVGGTFIDAKDYVKVEGGLKDATVREETFPLIRTLKDKEGLLVIGGFYGSTVEGRIGLLSEGGSDLTGSLVAVGVGAETYENFTDTLVCTAHPRLVPYAKPIREMTRRELRDLSYSGFSIFQDRAIVPLEGTSIRLHIRSTEKYPEEGTLVVEDRRLDPAMPVVGIAYKEGFSAFSVAKSGLNDTKGIFSQVLGEFSSRNLSVEFAPAGIDDISIVLEGSQVENVSEIKYALLNACGGGHVRYQDNLAAIVVAGKGIARDRKVSIRTQQALYEGRIPVLIESRGIENRCLIYIVNQEDGPAGVRILNDLFFPGA